MTRPTRFIGPALGALALAACASTNTVQVWRDPNYVPVPLHRIMVVGMIDDAEVRVTFENAIAQALVSRGFEVATSSATFPPGQFSEAGLVAYVKAQHADLVLFLHLTSFSAATADQPGVATSQSEAFAGKAYPGPTIWNGASTTRNFFTFQEAATPLATSIVTALAKADILVR
ncbi:MAG TPA: hypothetical protein VMT17_07970 [Anaeromyxobacteraceae bacterium]|nr:hypothetical protein [Anaeromyxobacteraceae bacterium]